MRITLTVLLFLGSIAHADTFAGCKKEVTDYGCKGDDKAIYECLLKHDKDLSPGCDKDHSAYEEAHGLKK